MCECGLFIIPLVFQDTYSQYCSDPKPKSHCESIFSPSLQIQYTDKPSRPTFPNDSALSTSVSPNCHPFSLIPSLHPPLLGCGSSISSQKALLFLSCPLWSVLMVDNFFFFLISVKLHQLLCQEISEVFLSHLEHTPNPIPDIIISPCLDSWVSCFLLNTPSLLLSQSPHLLFLPTSQLPATTCSYSQDS